MVRRIIITTSPFSEAPERVQKACVGLELTVSDRIPPSTAKSMPLLKGDEPDPSADYYNIEPDHFLTELGKIDPEAERWVRDNVEGLGVPQNKRLGELLTQSSVIFIRLKQKECKIAE